MMFEEGGQGGGVGSSFERRLYVNGTRGAWREKWMVLLLAAPSALAEHAHTSPP